MRRPLEGRRIAVFGPESEERTVAATLERAGAIVQPLRSADAGERWHGGMYAALVVVGDGGGGDPRLRQLVREFLVVDKPIAVHGNAVSVLLQAGGLAGRKIAAQGEFRGVVEAAGATCVSDPIHVDDALITASAGSAVGTFAERVVEAFGRRMEEHDVDEMSDMSFPASDPPSVSPSTAGPVDAERSVGDGHP
ncbi:MAG: DJ-1/PfpI family protein [Gemmatimonadaceae bacterium]